MEEVSKRTNDHAFSIELKSEDDIKMVVCSKDSEVTVLLESSLGELEKITFIEGRMLKIKGTNGILRMDLRVEELRSILPFFDQR